MARQATPDDVDELISYVQRLAEEPGTRIMQHLGEFAPTLEEGRAYLAEHELSTNSDFLVAPLPFGEPGAEQQVLDESVADKIVGAVNLSGGNRRATRHSAKLGISVAKEQRGKGLGGVLLCEALAWARQAGLRRVELNVFADNLTAIRLYQRFGFTVEGRRQRSIACDGRELDDLVMARLL